jgi:hypothetical protein
MTMTFWVILIREKQNFHYLAAKFNKKKGSLPLQGGDAVSSLK